MKARLSVNLNAGEISFPKLSQCKNTSECGQCPNGTGKIIYFPDELLNTSFTFIVFHNFYNKTNISTSPIEMCTWESTPNILFSGINTYTEIVYADTSNLQTGYSIDFLSNSSNRYISFHQPNPSKANVKDTLCVEVKYKIGNIIEVYLRSF